MVALQDHTVEMDEVYEGPMFTLPRIRTSSNQKLDRYSTWFQYGSVVAGDTNKSDGVALVRVETSYSYRGNNNNANYEQYYDTNDLFWADLVAYDCGQ
jgi:hypothetical protein